MNRRTLLAFAALAPIAACATPPTQDQLKVLIGATQSLETQLQAALPGILPLIPNANDKANVIASFKALQLATDQIAAANSLTAPGTVAQVQAIETALNAIVSVAASIPMIPEPYHSGLIAASLLLPIIESAVGLIVQQNTPVAAVIAARKVSAAKR